MASKARTTLRGAVASLALAALLVLPAAQAFAQAQTVTMTFKDVTEVFPEDVNACTGDLGTTTITYNGVLHISQDATGGTHTTGTLTGTVFFDATDPALPDLTGRFTQWFGDNNNRNIDVATFTFSVRATGTDGSRFTLHDVVHVTAETVDLSTDPPTFTGVRVFSERLRCG